MSKTIKELRELHDASTDGEWRWGQHEAGDIDEAVESYRKYLSHHVVYDTQAVVCMEHPKNVIGDDPNAPELMVAAAITGNGPNSANNARAIEAYHNSIGVLLDALEAAHKVMTWVGDGGDPTWCSEWVEKYKELLGAADTDGK